MNELKGCKRKPRRTIASRMTNIRPEKRKACKILLPVSVSLKDKFPPVYYQRYGNCTANAGLGCDDYLHHGNGHWIPSTTFTYYQQKRKEKPMLDDGSSVEKALKVVKRFGVCNSKVWGNDRPFDERPTDEAYQDGLKGREIKKWYEIHNVLQIKQALASGYPVAAAFSWVFIGYTEKTYTLYPSKPNKKDIDISSGHAVVIVGYDDLRQAVEIRNSWSNEWGDDGYAWMEYQTLNRCIWWDDTYAVLPGSGQRSQRMASGAA